jgi:hypothetical protein
VGQAIGQILSLAVDVPISEPAKARALDVLQLRLGRVDPAVGHVHRVPAA